MPFNTLVPAHKKPKEISMSCTAGRSKEYKINVIIPSTIYALFFKSATNFTVAMGDGSDAGKMLLKADPEGHFKAKNMKHTAIITLPPHPSYTPMAEFKSAEVQRREQADGSLLIELPAWATEEGWKKIRDARRSV